VIHAWAIEGDLDPAQIRSNTFEMEWPPRSGRRAAFPEIDRAEFFSLDQARLKMNSGQVALLDALAAL
jgi:predicted NUDIX family NTP pyrophosphohydrolase